MELYNRPVIGLEPPVIHGADAHRVAAARCGIIAAAQARGIEVHAVADEAVTALLTDLRHFCAARRIDFDRCTFLATFYFDADINGGQL